MRVLGITSVMAHLRLTRMLVIIGLTLAASNVMGQVRLTEETFRSDSRQWRLYKLESERLAVALPAPPAMSKAKRFSARLKKERWEQTLQASDGQVFFRVLIFEISKMTLDDCVADYNANNEWDLASQRPIKVGGVVGKELLSLNKNAISQLVVKDKRLYAFVASSSSAANMDVKSFFASIQLGKDLDGVEVAEAPGATLYAEPIKGLYERAEIDQIVRLLEKQEPTYTEKARNAQVVGTVVLKAVFTGDGRVVNIRVVRALPHGLTEQAIEVARTIKFHAAIKNGKPVSMWLQLIYNFELF
jgi:TonB family protein